MSDEKPRCPVCGPLATEHYCERTDCPVRDAKPRQPSPDEDTHGDDWNECNTPPEPTFTSERDKAADASVTRYNHADAWVQYEMRKVGKMSFCAGADWGHARASEEIERLKSDTPAMCAYCSFELPKGAKLSELQKHINRCEHHPLVKEIDRLDIANTKLRNQLAASHETITALSHDNESLRSVSIASQAREEGLLAAIECAHAYLLNWRATDAEQVLARARAAHGGGTSDDGQP